MQKGKLQSSLADLVIINYEGGRDVDNVFEGHGVATFQGGPSYAGDFCRGMMEGVGVYTWADGTTFTGDFWRNTITGNGKYAWPDGSVYVGEVLNGLRHGVGTMNRPVDGTPSYKGSWCNGKRHGMGTLFYDVIGECRYEGEWVSNQRHGFGVMYYASGNIYEGDWVQGVKRGVGKMIWRDSSECYEGEWSDDKQNGMGEHTWMQRSQESAWPGTQRQMCNRYHGQWKDGRRDGVGTFYYANGARYSGNWIDGVKEGHGVFIRDDGALYSGIFSSDRMVRSMPRCGLEFSGTHSVEPRVHLHLGDLVSGDPSTGRWEQNQLQKKLLRFNSELKGIYLRYILPEKSDGDSTNVFTMTSNTFLKFCMDTKVTSAGLSRSSISCVLRNMFRQHFSVVASARLLHQNSSHENDTTRPTLLHYHGNSDDPFQVKPHSRQMQQVRGRPILYREFVEAVVRVSVALAVCSAPKLSMPDAFELFMISNVCPLEQQSHAGVAQKNEGIVCDISASKEKFLSKVNSTLGITTSQFESVAIQTIITFLRVLCDQLIKKWPAVTFLTALTSVFSVYHLTEEGSIKNGKNISIYEVLLLSNAELTMSEVAEVLENLSILASDCRSASGDLMTAFCNANFKNADSTPPDKPRRNINAIPTMCRYSSRFMSGSNSNAVG